MPFFVSFLVPHVIDVVTILGDLSEEHALGPGGQLAQVSCGHVPGVHLHRAGLVAHRQAAARSALGELGVQDHRSAEAFLPRGVFIQPGLFEDLGSPSLGGLIFLILLGLPFPYAC